MIQPDSITLPDKMTAIAIEDIGGRGNLIKIETELPSCTDREILVRVHAAGVNRPDLLQRQGAHPPPPGASPFPGLDIAGEVVGCGPNVQSFKIGDRVTALAPGGGYAEYAVIDERTTLPLPQNYNYIKAAAIPETFFTVWSNVFDRGGLRAGETFLVHGGTSGIGTVAIQLAKAFGARVVATAGSEEKCRACITLGADLAINYRTQDFVEEAKRFSDNKGIDVILDMVGGDYTNKNYHLAALEGRIVQIAYLNGAKAQIDLSPLMRKRLIHTGSTLRHRDIAFKGAIACTLKEKVWPLLERGIVSPVIDKIFALDDAADAHEYMRSGQNIGKIILQVIQD